MPTSTPRKATVRCAFCGTLNRVDLARAADRPKCGECAKPLLLVARSRWGTLTSAG